MDTQGSLDIAGGSNQPQFAWLCQKMSDRHFTGHQELLFFWNQIKKKGKSDGHFGGHSKKKQDSRKGTLQSKGRVKTEAHEDANGNIEFE